MLNITVLVSGGGTNLQAILDAQAGGGLEGGAVKCVVSSNPGAYAITRAERAGIKTVVIDKKAHTPESFDDAVLVVLKENNTDIVVFAGFLSILGKKITDAYAGRMINVHPSLIPSFCGKSFYGLRVHEAALEYGVKVTGATVHYVNEVTDGGEIILQKAVPVEEGDTPETLQRRVMEAERELLPKAISIVCKKLKNSTL